MKTPAIAVMTLVILLGTSVCSAQKPDSPRRKGEGAAKGQRGEQRQGRQGGDPAQMVARMMQEFDKDGDQKLDSKELAALLTSMRERRGGGPGAQRGGRPGGQQGRPGAQRQRRGDGNAENAGGRRPQRPSEE